MGRPAETLLTSVREGRRRRASVGNGWRGDGGANALGQDRNRGSDPVRQVITSFTNPLPPSEPPISCGHERRVRVVVSREQVVEAIRRVAAANGGRPPGKGLFTRETGIRESYWEGRYWARWSDALIEAGFDPNRMNERFDDSAVLAALADEVRRLGRFPTHAELRLRRRADSSFPSWGVFERFGARATLIARLAEYCATAGGWDDVALILTSAAASSSGSADSSDTRRPRVATGYVYLIKAGRFYKLGRSNAIGRRERELAIQLPEKARRVHVIETDDPVGIERYWHQRFADRRVRPDAEWFDLTSDHVAAFKRRMFM